MYWRPRFSSTSGTAFLKPDTEPVAFTTALMRKDAALTEELAAELDVRLPTLAAAVAVLDEALRDGLGEADMASVLSVLNGEPQRSRQSVEPDDMTEEP